MRSPLLFSLILSCLVAMGLTVHAQNQPDLETREETARQALIRALDKNAVGSVERVEYRLWKIYAAREDALHTRPALSEKLKEVIARMSASPNDRIRASASWYVANLPVERDEYLLKTAKAMLSDSSVDVRYNVSFLFQRMQLSLDDLETLARLRARETQESFKSQQVAHNLEITLENALRDGPLKVTSTDYFWWGDNPKSLLDFGLWSQLKVDELTPQQRLELDRYLRSSNIYKTEFGALSEAMQIRPKDLSVIPGSCSYVW